MSWSRNSEKNFKINYKKTTNLSFVPLGYLPVHIFLSVPEPERYIRILNLLFSLVAFKMPAKYLFFPKCFCLGYYLPLVHLLQPSKIKSYEKFSKTVEIKVLLKFLCLLMEGSESAQIITDRDRPKTYGSYGPPKPVRNTGK
jgi:hypothetical protein